MSFFARRQSSTTTPTQPTSVASRNSHPDSDWAKIREIKDDKLRIWILTAQNVSVEVAESDHGFFYKDEMYVIVKGFNKNRKMHYDVHFWMGAEKAKKMTADPPAKVSQLMTGIDASIILHREIEGFESPKFKRYFKVFGVLRGDSSTVFDAEKSEKYENKLLNFQLNKEKTRIEVFEVPISRNSLLTGDVYIFDEGKKMTQWNGSICDEEERTAARRYIDSALKKRKTKCTSEFYDEEDLLDNNELYTKLGKSDVPQRPPALSKKNFQKKMFRLSDESRKLVMNPVYTGKIYRTGINPDDVTIIDTFKVLFAYIGPGASADERNSVWKQSDIYLKSTEKPMKSITVFAAGCYCEEFEEVWDDAAA